jgi:hypothetical protein
MTLTMRSKSRRMSRTSTGLMVCLLCSVRALDRAIILVVDSGVRVVDGVVVDAGLALVLRRVATSNLLFGSDQKRGHANCVALFVCAKLDS